MSFHGSGTLIVKPVSAKLTRDTEFMGKMDPYCVCKLGGQSQKSREHKDAGKHPSWNDTLVFKRTSEHLLEVEVWDKDTVSRDDLVGAGSMALQAIFENKKGAEWIQLSYKGKKAGQVLLQFEWQPDSAQCAQVPNLSNFKPTASVVPMALPGQSGYYPPPQGPGYPYPPPPGYIGGSAQNYTYGSQPPQYQQYPQQPPPYNPNQSMVPPQYPNQAPGYAPQPPPQQPNYPPQQQPGYSPLQPQQPGYPPQQAQNYPPQQPGYPPAQPGYPQYNTGNQQPPGYPPQQPAGYPAQQPNYPAQPPQGYPNTNQAPPFQGGAPQQNFGQTYQNPGYQNPPQNQPPNYYQTMPNGNKPY